jgi:tripartite-type tricarboxylate transporter receptor subunit TctC
MRWILIAVAGIVAGLSGGVAVAQTGTAYPSRPIRIIVPSGAGGITDILARVIAARLSENLGQQVIVDPRAGAGGVVGTEIAANATPDGYTLLMVIPSHASNPSLLRKLPYDSVRSFAPITLVSAVATVLIVPASSPVRSVQELVGHARERPGQLNYGSVGRGTLGHLSMELFRSMTGIQMTHITYKGSPQVMASLIGGEINAYFIASAGSAATQMRAGRIRALGVSTKNRQAALPEVPPIADTVPDFEARGWNGILAPAGTPRAVISRLHAEIVKVLNTAEFKERLGAEGAELVGNTPEEFADIMRADIAKWARVVKAAGIETQ